MSSAVVGVDLGFQNSVIAAAGKGGVDVILNGNSQRLNPSLVGFDQNRKMGEMAASASSSNFKNTVYGMKRLIGLAYDDPRATREMQLLPFTCVPMKHKTGGPDGIGVKVNFNNNEETILPIEAVAGMMIKHMGQIAAEKAAQHSTEPASKLFPQDWVIAIPNYYDDAQRRAVLAGCEMVGVSGVQRLMHENTATALAYGIFKDLKKVFTKDKPTYVMFIDMGASAYTVSIASFEPGTLTVKSAYCDEALGGRDFDMVIAGWIAQKFEEKFAGKLSGKPMERVKSRIKLLSAAEKAKKTLSPQGVKEAHLNIEMLMDDLDFHIALEANEYERLCQPLLDRLAAPIEAALLEAKLTAADLDSVEIVGGSTRIGCVKRKIQEILKVESLSMTMNADEAVARGAALQSAILSPRFKVLPYDIHEAQPYPIKISWEDNAVASGMEVDATANEATPTDSVIMFDRGLSFPIVRRVTLRRAGNFQVKSSYDESATQYGLKSCKEIATFTIKGASEAEHKVRVNVKQDIHGIINMSSAQMVEEIEEEGGEDAKEETAEGGEKKKKIKKTNLDFSVARPLEWTRDEINQFYEAEVAMANVDRIVKETADMRNELESYIYDMRDKVASDSQLGPYGSDREKEAFLGKNEATENWLYEDGFDATKNVYAEKLAELKKLGGPMERRQAEATLRPASLESLRINLERYQKWVNESQADERYQHITDEERETVRTITDTISAWMYEMMDKQGGLALCDDPVMTVADLRAKNKELVDKCMPIMNKPVPKPAPVPAPKPAEPATAANGEPMEGVEENAGSSDSAAESSTPMEVES